MCEDAHGIGRRALFVTGAAAALTLGSVSFAAADGQDQQTRTIRGTLPTGSPDYVYVPVEVPSGVREIKVAYTYDKPSVPAGTQGNALDIGIFDERGTDLGGRGFRGWSGGARSEFFIRADDASPGYVPGPVREGTWHVALGPYTVAPQGLSYELTITLTYGEPGRTPAPVYPPERARGRGRAWYRGDCHLHSWYSDGRRTPAEIAALARTAGLDFINSSDHNTHSAHPHWATEAGDDLMIMLGEEITTRNGHVVALGTEPGTFVDWRYRARDNRWAKYARQIRRAGGLVVPAHPHATCIGCGWKFGFGEADAVEVWNGPYTPDDEVTLAEWDNLLVATVREGREEWLPAMGNSDAHRDPDAVGLPQTVVLADDLTREAIQDGIRAGRSYVAESQHVSLTFTATGGRGRHAGIGERLEVTPDTPVTIHVEATGAPRCTIRLVTDQGVLLTSDPLPVTGSGTLEWQTTPAYAAYVRAELRHETAAGPLPGALAAFTNPIFLGRR
ncbi:CehA/McbA family metallohydrolase [Streptomyces spinosirectus]|uniref:CehA/McbA family metallohydrolase n=1 Tax=Streptomyces TaxID=1883 RepID=UPI001C9E05C1|nr:MULTISPECIES: CehA/McbA family metallohydrolase [Streptomyces]MBY8343498.1 CehA/McbA family metallohydrolase [Streptomyces plumbidurans]UIR19799.1 CehA/McbA family metallohydrolase [Streptomyces spinosirectus]